MPSQTDKFCRYFTKIWNIFIWYATITDAFTDGKSLLIFYRELKNIHCICHYHRHNIFVSIFPVGIFFWRAFSVCKTIGNCFFADRLGDEIWDYRRKTCRQTLSIGDLLGKKIIDEVWISHRRIWSVGKSVNSPSE